MLESVEIEYFIIDSVPDHQLNLKDQADEEKLQETWQPHRLQASPDIPAAPTTAISGTDVIISWIAPFDGGSVITVYGVKIQRGSGSFMTYSGCSVSTTTCIVPISDL